MPRLLAISPHLDDAVFSAGGTLALRVREGWDVTIATVFTLSVPNPQGFALACQLDKGLAPDVDYMALRRDEDISACQAIGVAARHLPFPEAPHRGYAGAPTLFTGVRADDDVARSLQPALRELAADLRPDLILGPAGVGNHADHLIVRDILCDNDRSPPLLLWDDWPYADRDGHDHGDIVVAVDSEAQQAKAIAAAFYRSQLGFQFGGAAALAARLDGIWSERFRMPTSRLAHPG